MKLDDFLKCKKVKCVKAHYNSLTVGKEYSVLNIRIGVEVIDDAGSKYYWRANHFEPVIDQAENPLQGAELTPEFETEASDPKFKVGDHVYCFGEKSISKINKYVGDETYSLRDSETLYQADYLTLANQENYERLKATFPDIDFERPPKPLTGIELAKKLIAKGHNYLVVDTVIGIRVLTRLEGNTLIDSNNVRLDELDDITPLNDETGEPLTESVLDE